MAEKICDDSDQNFDWVSSLYLSKDKDLIVLEVEGRSIPGLEGTGTNIQDIYLSEENVRRLIDRLNVYLAD